MEERSKTLGTEEANPSLPSSASLPSSEECKEIFETCPSETIFVLSKSKELSQEGATSESLAKKPFRLTLTLS